MTDGRKEPDHRLSVTIRALAGYILAAVDGDIDFATHTRLDDELTTALAATATALIIDLTQVGFCDSSGLNTFSRLTRQARARGISVILVGVHGRVANVLHMTRLDTAFHLRPDLETAIRWLEDGTRHTAADDPPTVA